MDELETELRHWLLDREPDPPEGLDERMRRVYRRQVRRSLTRGVRLGLPITRRLVDEEWLDDVIGQWMEESPPTTRLYWRLPIEFGIWLREEAPLEVAELPHGAVPELIHWETMVVDVKNAPEPDGEGLSQTMEESAMVVLDPSARLGIYAHPVYRMSRDSESWPESKAVPDFVVVFREEERPRWRLIEPQVGQLLGQCAQGMSLGQGLEALEEIYGAIKREDLMTGIEALHERGIILGFEVP